MRQKEKEEKEKDSKYRTNRGTPNDLGSYLKNRKNFNCNFLSFGFNKN